MGSFALLAALAASRWYSRNLPRAHSYPRNNEPASVDSRTLRFRTRSSDSQGNTSCYCPAILASSPHCSPRQNYVQSIFDECGYRRDLSFGVASCIASRLKTRECRNQARLCWMYLIALEFRSSVYCGRFAVAIIRSVLTRVAQTRRILLLGSLRHGFADGMHSRGPFAIVTIVVQASCVLLENRISFVHGGRFAGINCIVPT
jgi:hypothetical protein